MRTLMALLVILAVTAPAAEARRPHDLFDAAFPYVFAKYNRHNGHCGFMDDRGLIWGCDIGDPIWDKTFFLVDVRRRDNGLGIPYALVCDDGGFVFEVPLLQTWDKVKPKPAPPPQPRQFQ